MNPREITAVLSEHGRQLFNAPPNFIEFTKVRAADDLLNDLDLHPHAFVLGCVMDRQIRAEKAWLIPYRFAQKLGTFSFSRLATLTLDETRELMSKPEPLHRYTSVKTTLRRPSPTGLGLCPRSFPGSSITRLGKSAATGAARKRHCVGNATCVTSALKAPASRQPLFPARAENWHVPDWKNGVSRCLRQSEAA